MTMHHKGGVTELMIRGRASEFGVEFVGFVRDFPNHTPDWARSFIVLGIPLILPLLETCPSIWGLEHERTVKILIGKAINRVSALFCNHDIKSERVEASWTEISEAGCRSGLGTIGENGLLLTKLYGPRVLWASVATSAEFECGEIAEINLCLNCGHCRRLCPAGARNFGDEACAAYERELSRDFKNPCWACLRACPVGEDRYLFESMDFEKYFDDRAPDDGEHGFPACKAWAHVRSYGSYPHADIDPKYKKYSD
jgi:ferredoxin